MTRQTSIDVYRQIQSEGLLSNRRWEVYDCLFQYGPLTQMETTRKLVEGTSVTEHSFTPRFAELERMGVIRSLAERTCKITGRFVLTWDVTDRLPDKITQEQKESSKKQIERLTKERDKFRFALLMVWKDFPTTQDKIRSFLNNFK